MADTLYIKGIIPVCTNGNPLENQTLSEKYIPLRILNYDGASYRSQLLKSQDEKVKIHPVITVVLYFGMERWTTPRTLKEALGTIHPDLEPYVNDYKVHIFEIA